MHLLVLIVVCAVLWSLESGECRREHVVPNVGLTAIVLLMNLALSFAAASVAGFAASHRAGLLHLVELPAGRTFSQESRHSTSSRTSRTY